MVSNPEPNRVGSPLISLREASDYLGVSTSTLDRLSKEGQITCIRIGTRSRFTYEDLDAYIERNTRRAVI